MLNKILLGVAALLIVFSVLVMQQPDSYRIERSIGIEAPAESVYSRIADLKQWPPGVRGHNATRTWHC